MNNLKLTSLVLVCFALPRPASAQDSLAFKYKCALDFALHLDSALKADDPSTWQIDHRYSGIHIVKSSDPNVLEQFECYAYDYKLYRLPSFSDKAPHFVLSRSYQDSSWLTFYLFSGDSLHPTYLDKYDVGTQQATFQLDTFNGGDIIRILAQSTGTGLYDRSLTLLAIKHEFLVELFHCDLSYLDATTDSTMRGIGAVKFVDLDKDGFLDVVYELTVDVLAPHQNPDVWVPGDLEKAKALHRSSRVVEHYIWNKESCTFERSN